MTITQDIEQNKKLKAQVVEDTVMILTTNLNITNQDKQILTEYVDEWLDGICLDDNIRDVYCFCASCFYKMKSCDEPLIQKIYKLTQANFRKRLINEDFT